MRVLLVDDDPAMVRLAREILRASGVGEVVEVDSARAALGALDGIDVVLLDHHLPDTTGLEVLEAIRSRPAPPAVVMVTAYGNESLAADALRRGADDYLAKDVSLAEMLPRVLERVRRSRELRKALAAAERELVRTERLAAIGEMTVTLHHEINNPLMAALTDVHLLLTDPDPEAERSRETLRSIESALYRIRDIVHRIGNLREVRTKQYLPGIGMVDLAADPPEEPAARRGAAHVWLGDEDLARVVSLLLRHAGFQVERHARVGSLEIAAPRLGTRLVVIAGGTGAAGAHPLGGFEPPPDREYSVVALVAGDASAARRAGADHVIQLPFDPGTFTAEIIEAAAGH